MAVSLVSLPTVAVASLAFLVVLGLVARAVRPWSALVVVRTAMWSILATAALALVVHASGAVPLDIPRWFYLLALVPFLGPALALVAGRGMGASGRTLAVACLPLGLVVAVLVANQHYQYWPTLESALGRDHSDPLLDAATVSRLVQADHDDLAAAGLGGGRPDQGRLVDVAIPGTTSGFRARPARVWLPPGFLTDPNRPRPVVELIGGTPSWTSDWTRAAGIDRIADGIAAAHGGEAPLLVMVDANGSAFGDTECVGPAEAYLTADVPAYVEAHFGASTDRRAWGVAGYSEGGTCAITLALRHADRFSAFADLAGDAHPDVGGRRHTVRTLFGGSDAAFAAHDPEALLGREPAPDLAGWFGSGRDDGAPRRATALLAHQARAAGMAVEEYTGPGGHDFGFVGSALRSALPWFELKLSAAQSVPAPPPDGTVGAGTVP